jgi:RHS repeat-associated protein
LLLIQNLDRAAQHDLAAKGQLFAIVDACAVPEIDGIANRLGSERAACLYLGTAADTYGDNAPYLLQCDGTLLDRIVRDYGDTAWGLFIIADAQFDAVRRHLRQFLRVRSPGGDDWQFRFYDPRILPLFLNSSTPDELNTFFGPIDAFLAVDTQGAGQAAGRDPKLRRSPANRGVGELFRLSPAHVAALRRHGMSAGLLRTFEDSGMSARRDPKNDDVLVDNPDGGTMRMAFGDDGFIGRVDSPLGRKWHIKSDEQGRTTAMRTPSGAQLDIAYDSLGQAAQVARDGNILYRASHDMHGRLERISFPDGTDVQTIYDNPGASGIVDRAGNYVAAQKDRLGRVERFDYDGDDLALVTDGNGHATRYEYATSKKPDRVLHPNGTTEEYRYNPAGQLNAWIRGDGSRLDIKSDDAGRPILIKDEHGKQTVLAYNDAGSLVSAENDVTSLGWSYDDAGFLIAETQGSVSIKYDYAVDGKISAITYPGGDSVSFARDLDMRLISVTDWTGGQHRIEYAPDDRGYRMVSPGGVSATYWQNSAGFTTDCRVEAPSGPVFETAYAYDGEDRIHQIADSHSGSVTHRYDAEDQLLEVCRTQGPSEHFTYDHAGNRIFGPDGPAQFDAVNQIIAQGSGSFSHDLRGNMIERSDNRGAVQYHYDSRDRLIEVSSVNGLIARYAYDPVGRRIYKDVRHGDTILRTRFYWAGEQMIREETQAVSAGGDPVLGSLGSSRDYLYWPESFTPMLLRVSGNGAIGAVYNYHNDPGGGVARVTDRSGAVVWQAGHGAFGGAAPVVQQIVQPLRFAGQYHDSETGLHYNRYRYYDPALGRYITRDPMGITQGLNVYCYSGNDPIGRCDPMGLWGWKDTLSVVAAVAVGIVVFVTLPVSGPLLLVAAGAAAGATAYGLNEALNQEVFCLKCILMEAGKGALVGAFAALPVAFLPASAGLPMFLGANGLSGFMGYLGDFALTPGAKWNWGDAARAALLGAGLGALGRYGSKAIPKRVPPQSDFTKRYLAGSGGRWGLPSTRKQNYDLGQKYAKKGRGKVTGGGGITGEEYIPGAGPGTKGSTYPDITVKNGNGTTTRIQTVDMETNAAGQRVPTQRELDNAQRIRDAFPDDELILVPKE